MGHLSQPAACAFKALALWISPFLRYPNKFLPMTTCSRIEPNRCLSAPPYCSASPPVAPSVSSWLQQMQSMCGLLLCGGGLVPEGICIAPLGQKRVYSVPGLFHSVWAIARKETIAGMSLLGKLALER